MFYHVTETERSAIKFLVEADSREEATRRVDEFINDPKTANEYRNAMNESTEFDEIVRTKVYRDLEEYKTDIRQVSPLVKQCFEYDYLLEKKHPEKSSDSDTRYNIYYNTSSSSDFYLKYEDLSFDELLSTIRDLAAAHHIERLSKFVEKDKPNTIGLCYYVFHHEN